MATMVSQGSIEFAGLSRPNKEWAKILGVTPEYVSMIRKGKRTPAPPMREKILAAGGPEVALWDQLIHKPSTVGDKLGVADPLADPEEDGPASGSLPPVAATPDAVRDMADRLMKDAQTMQSELMRGEMDPGGRMNMLAKLASVVTELGKITGAAIINERQVLMSPSFRNLVDIILEAIKPFPDALESVVNALESRRVTP